MPTLAHGTDSPTPEPYVGGINVYSLPKTGGETDDPRLVAVFELPNVKIMAAHVEPFQRTIATGAHTAWGAGAVQALLHLRLGNSNFCIPATVLLSESVRLAQERQDGPVLHVPWEKWGFRWLHPMDGEFDFAPIVAAGLRVIYDNVILDFNQYDAARNLYSPEEIQDRSVLCIGSVREDIVPSTRSRPYRRSSQEAELPLRVLGPKYRQIPCSMGSPESGLSHGDVYVIEEEDGPKVPFRPLP